MSYFLRKLPLSRLLLLCALVVALGASLTALAFALGAGPTPPPKPLADAIHDALTAQVGGNSIQGISAQVQLSDRLLEGANLDSGGGGSSLSSDPLLTGASGRLWIAKDGAFRLELQSEQGDTQIYGDGDGTISMYDASSNTLYQLNLPSRERDDHPAVSWSTPAPAGASDEGSDHEAPSVAKIEEALAKLDEHAEVSGAEPTDIAGQAAYTVHVSPKEKGSLLGGAELSWDAVYGVPLRAAIYATGSSDPVIELAATAISYGPVESSTLEFKPPAGARVEAVKLPEHGPEAGGTSGQGGEHPQHPRLKTFGKGLSTIAVLEGKAGSSAETEASSPLPEGVQQVKVGSIAANELTTQLGTLLSFERSGVTYLLAGAVQPSAVEAVAKGL